MIIYGAGMAGLLAAQMLRRFKPVVHEGRAQLPQSHKAVLRFRSDAVARATGLPFRRVKVNKALKWGKELTVQPMLNHVNAYSLKVTGQLMQRSIANLQPEERWIAPVDFVQTLAEQADIRLSSPLESLPEKLDEPAVSTIHLPTMTRILQLEKVPVFKYRNIFVVRAEVACNADLYQTIYYPGAEPYYRASMEGKTLIVESIQTEMLSDRDPSEINTWLRDIIFDFGMGYTGFNTEPEITLQPFGKIMPVDERWRREFIYELTRRKNVYSLGRFATWRQILLDDVVKDVEQIERMISSGDDYGRRLAS